MLAAGHVAVVIAMLVVARFAMSMRVAVPELMNVAVARKALFSSQ